MNWSEIEKAWLAGFIDGEGYIGTTLQRKRETHHQSASFGLTSFTEFDAEIHKQLIGLNKRGPIDYAAA